MQVNYVPCLVFQASRASSVATEHPQQVRSTAREGPETLQQGRSMSGTAEEGLPGALMLLILQKLMHASPHLSSAI